MAVYPIGSSKTGGGGSGSIEVGVTPSDGTANVLLKTNATAQVANSTVTDNGTTVSTPSTLSLTGAGAVATPQLNFGTTQTGIFGGANFLSHVFSGVSRWYEDFANNCFRLASASQLTWSNTADNPVATNDVGLARSAAGVLAVTNSATGPGSLEFQEQTAPAAPAANFVRIYAEDNGSGKTRLMARFATGAAVQIAIEP